MEDLPEGTTVVVLVDLGAALCDSSLTLDTRLEAARRMRIVHLLHPKEAAATWIDKEINSKFFESVIDPVVEAVKANGNKPTACLVDAFWLMLGYHAGLMSHMVFLVSCWVDPVMARYHMNMMGLMAKFDTMLPSFLKELKDLVAHEGGKWEWLRHSYFHIPSYACYFECQDKGTGVVGASKRYIEMEIHTTSLFALAAAGPEQILKVAQDLDDGTTSSKEQGADLNPYTIYSRMISFLVKFMPTESFELVEDVHVDLMINIALGVLRKYDEIDPDALERVNEDTLTGCCLLMLGFSKSSRTKPKLLTTDVSEVLESKLDLVMYSMKRSPSAACTLALVNLFGREESNQYGVSSHLVHRLAADYAKLAKPNSDVSAMMTGKDIVKGILEMTYSDRNKTLLLAAGLLSAVMEVLDPDGAVSNKWGNNLNGDERDFKWISLCTDFTEGAHKILLNLVLTDAGKSVILADKSYLEILHKLSKIAAANEQNSDDRDEEEDKAVGGGEVTAQGFELSSGAPPMLVAAVAKGTPSHDRRKKSRLPWRRTLQATMFELGLVEHSDVGESSDNGGSGNMVGNSSAAVDGDGGATAPSTDGSSKQAGKHIMISYCWAQQEIVLKVSARLQAAGYNVWIDVEQMRGSTVAAMAEAVEGAACLLVGMSRGYKESANCRLEANYAQARGVPFVFLMLEENYHPNGWAGILMGTELHYPVSDAGNQELQPVLDWLSHISETMVQASQADDEEVGAVGAVGAPPIQSGSAAAPVVTLGSGSGSDGSIRNENSGSSAAPNLATHSVPSSGGMFEALLTQMVQQQGQTQHLLFSQQVSQLQAQVAAVQLQQQQQQVLLFAVLAVGAAVLFQLK